MIEMMQNIDFQILKWIANITGNVVIDKSMIFITTLGDKGLVWIIISIFLIANKKYRKIGLMALFSLVLATLLGEGLIKHLVQRLRPFAKHESFEPLVHISSIFSFPSGHTTSSFAVAGVLANGLKKYQKTIYGLAILIGISRLYVFVHYPSDVIVGAFLGLLCALITNRIFEKKYN